MQYRAKSIFRNKFIAMMPLSHCYGLNSMPPNSYVEALTPSVAVL